MNEQEMQFADPDWKPTGPLSAPQDNVAADAVAPRPGTNSAYDAGQYVTSMAPYEQGYRGTPFEEEAAFLPPVARQTTAGSTGGAHRRSWWWVWLILIILFLSMLGGISRSVDRGHGFGPDPSFQHPFPKEQGSSTYDLQNASQISITNQQGSITVQVADGNSNQVLVRTQDGSQAAVSYAGNSMNITSADGDATNLLITVPQNVALNLDTVMGSIEVDGFTGQLSAQTGYGPITLNYDTLNRQSKITSDSGYIGLEQGSLHDATITDQRGSILLDQEQLSGQVEISTGGNGAIAFNGSLDARGKYQFTTDTGRIDLALPAGTSMQTQVSAGSGSYHSDFSASSKNSPQAQVILQTNAGDITVMKQ